MRQGEGNTRGKMLRIITKIFVIYIVLTVGLMVSVETLQARTVAFESRTITQVKRLRGGTHRVPLNEYFGLSVSDLPKNFSFTTDFRGEAGPPTSDGEFDLYQATFHVEPVGGLLVDGGRQWLMDGFDGSLLDGLKLGIFPESWRVGFSLYAGVPRYVDEGTFRNVTEGLLVGTQVHLRNVENTAAQISLRWRKIDVTLGDYTQNDNIAAAVALSHQFTKLWSTPSIYSNFEYSIPGKTVEAGTVGLDLYPHWRVAFNLEGSYYDSDRDLNQATLLGQYLTDQMVQAREGVEVKLVHGFRLFEDFSYQRYGVVSRGNENGYIASSGLGHYLKVLKLSSTGEFYYGKSFGGKVYGGLIEWTDKYFEEFDIQTSLDISRYSKITNQTDTAISLVGGVDYQFVDCCSFGLGGEFNHNNWFSKEGRVTVRLVVGGGGSPRPEVSLRSPRLMRQFHEI